MKNFEYPPGATPLNPDEFDGLKKKSGEGDEDRAGCRP